ncbi:MAG: GHKL domain-containing protein, partial [Eubacterium sp.]|nr:GHKL domain-containing protein [Eubacterium sp.]
KKLFFFVSVWAILGIGFYKSLKERIAPPETPPKIRVYQNVFLITVAFLEIFLVNYIIIEVIRSNSLYMTLVVIAMIALLAFDTSFVIFIQRMERTRSMERRLELERQQRALEENYYATVEHQYQSSLAMIHRMEDHIQRLKDYYDRGEAGAARRYAEKTLEEIAGTGMSLGCRDRTLAIILEDKRFVCERRGIVLSVRDESRGLGFMDVFDITTIFSNLLDNAIQAAQRLDGAEVEVSLFEYGQMLGINVENPYVEAPVKRGAVFLSTKSGAGHGVGLKNVAAAVKKYQGEMDIRTDDGIFKVQILLPLARETED